MTPPAPLGAMTEALLLEILPLLWTQRDIDQEFLRLYFYLRPSETPTIH
ncbi:hypothetical protein [Azotobacter chroococcum]|nr:hypothetical protein [Azotobacter chroococcum]